MRTNRRKLMAAHGLPSNYERLEYIENTSTAYIDCGLRPKYTFDYEIKTNIVTGNCIFGCKYYYDDTIDFRIFWYQSSIIYLDIGRGRIDLRTPSGTKIIHVKFGNYFIENLINKEKVTGVAFDENMNGALISNLFLFNGYGYEKGKVWLLNINDNGKPIRKFIPVKRKSDGMVGMYELVGRKFYTSPNGVAFTGG